MIDVIYLVALMVPVAAAGLACLGVLDALPRRSGERLLAGFAIGLGLAGLAGLGLAVTGQLRPLPIAGVGLLALVGGGRDLGRTLRGLPLPPGPGRAPLAWLLLAVGAVVLASELPPMLAPPIGGDQIRYHLVYPRLYALKGGLVDTPWTADWTDRHAEVSPSRCAATCSRVS